VVLLDGVATRSCTVFTVQAAGAAVTTIEGLTPAGALHPMQVALSRCHGLQCGFCTPGVVLAAAELLATGGRLDEASVRDAMAGQLCRCTGYQGIVDAVLAAGAELDAQREDAS
jgi:carbon-monoxide dehydrogenase small subunit